MPFGFALALELDDRLASVIGSRRPGQWVNSFPVSFFGVLCHACLLPFRQIGLKVVKDFLTLLCRYQHLNLVLALLKLGVRLDEPAVTKLLVV